MFWFLLILTLKSIYGFIGYDCGSRHLNITTLSLLEVGECELPESKINITREYLQLLQINEYTETKVIQCKLEIHRTIYHCGMFSHISIVSNGENEYILEVSKSLCEDLHKTGNLMIHASHMISGIKINQTKTHSIVFAGYVNGDGKCDGSGYSDPFGTWENVVVQGTIKITLMEQIAQIKLNSNTIRLRSGTTCSLSEENCIDQEGGYTFWKSIPKDNCNFQEYSVLYEGLANKMVDYDFNQKQIIYSLVTQDITFALAAKGQQSVCGYTLIKTEHPKLLIFETEKENRFTDTKHISVSNLDIFAYVNSKFVYVEKHIRSQMKQLYRDVLTQKCNLERQTLKNTLTIATQAPDEFAYDLMKGPGYMAVIAGEVVHIVKCVPVEVKIEHGESCYAELQVTRNNKTFYLTPRTHILKSKGTEIPCNKVLPSTYYIGEKWYNILPFPTSAVQPTVIKPMTKPTWEYINPAELATNGIYSDKELDQIRERIMFPVEQPAELNDIAREMRGYPSSNKEGSLFKLLNEDVVEKLVDNTWNKMWSRFITFGTVSAGCIAIFTIIHLVKTIVDIIIQGYALHSVYGWSIHILGALWSSVSHLLLHLATPKQTNSQDVEMGELLPETSKEKDQLKEQQDGMTSKQSSYRLI